MRLLRRAFRYLLYGGSWTIRPYEQEILEAAAKALLSPDGEVLLHQLDDLDHIKRLHSDRMVTFYFDYPKDLAKLSARETEHSLAKLKLRYDRGSLAVSVVSHRGLLSSLDFSKSPKKLLDKGFDVETVQTVDLRRPTLAEEFDKEEHGQ